MTEDNAKRYWLAADEGLISSEDALKAHRARRGRNVRTLMDTLIGDGSDNTAEAVLDRITSGEKGESLAAQAGIAPDVVSGWRQRIDGVRRRREAEKEVAAREERQKVGREFTVKELGLRDVAPELWAASYEEMGQDQRLRKADPNRAMRYMDTARELREAEARAKAREEKAAAKAAADKAKAAAKEKAREEKAAKAAVADAIKEKEGGLKDRLVLLNFRREGGFISQEDAQEEQLSIWKDFTKAALGKEVGGKFIEDFKGDFGKMRNGQQREATRYVMQLFGFDGETDASGRAAGASRRQAAKEGTRFEAPFEVERWYGDSKPEVKAGDLFRLLDEMWKMLEVSHKGIDRLQAAKDLALKFKEDYLKGEMDGVIQGTADGLAGMNRDALEREEMERDDGKR